MNRRSESRKQEGYSRLARSRAYSIHLYTACGVVFAFLAARELMKAQPDPRLVFLWIAIAVLIDATDGPLARLVDIQNRAPAISGRVIDEIVDYLVFSFIPLMMVWRMHWIPDPAGVWISIAMIASLFGFANVHAKQEDEGFFLGFPSYWNAYAFYAGILHQMGQPTISLILLLALSLLTVLPVRFIYPNLAPRPWKWPLWTGALIWLALMLAMLPSFPQVSSALFWISLIYPLLYVVLSVVFDMRARRRTK